jgi:hypothetical protein
MNLQHQDKFKVTIKLLPPVANSSGRVTIITNNKDAELSYELSYLSFTWEDYKDTLISSINCSIEDNTNTANLVKHRLTKVLNLVKNWDYNIVIKKEKLNPIDFSKNTLSCDYDKLVKLETEIKNYARTANKTAI